MKIKPLKSFNMALTPPPDKSITIRALILGMMASGATEIINPLISGDTVSAINAITELGAQVEVKGGAISVVGGKISSATVDAGNSATTMRLLSGAVSGYEGSYRFVGDKSLCGRNMKQLIGVLCDMGSKIESSNGYPPLIITGGKLHGADFVIKQPSAQIKSAILLAALSAEGVTTVTEEIKTRTHTEDMLPLFGANITREGNKVSVTKSKLNSAKIDVPADISSAAYPMVLAAKRGFCYLKNVGTSRRELIDFLISIGADIALEEKGDRANITVKKSDLRPFTISGSLATALIDELPLLAVLASVVEGESVIKDAAALKNKECDRISCTALNLREMGVSVTELPDGLIIKGGTLAGGNAKSFGDHRMAMSMAVANALSVKGGTIDDDGCVEISYPSFWELLI